MQSPCFMALACFMCNAVYALNSACSPSSHPLFADSQLTGLPPQAGHCIACVGLHIWKASKCYHHHHHYYRCHYCYITGIIVTITSIAIIIITITMTSLRRIGTITTTVLIIGIATNTIFIGMSLLTQLFSLCLQVCDKS